MSRWRRASRSPVGRHDGVGAAHPALDPHGSARQLVLARPGRGGQAGPCPRAPAKRRPAPVFAPLARMSADAGDRSERTEGHRHQRDGEVSHGQWVTWTALMGGEVCGTCPVSETSQATPVSRQRGNEPPPESSASISPLHLASFGGSSCSTAFPCSSSPAPCALGLGITGILISLPVQAGPPPPVTVREAASLRDSGRILTLTTRAVEGVGLVEAQSADRTPGPGILAASPDGLTVAFTPVGPGQIGPLGLAHADGTQIEVALPGVRGAAFAPSGGWLAVVDQAGSLWRVDRATGDAALVADGPFGSDVTVLPDGRILALRLSSVEAPYWAAAEIVDMERGGVRVGRWVGRRAGPARVPGGGPPRWGVCPGPPPERGRSVRGARGRRRVGDVL